MIHKKIKEYHSHIAEILSVVGDFLNNVKKPWFIIVIVGMYFIYLLLSELIGIKNSIDESNKLVNRQNSLIENIKKVDKTDPFDLFPKLKLPFNFKRFL